MPDFHSSPPPMQRWTIVALALAACLLCQIGFAWRQKALAPSPDIPDVRFGYTPGDLAELFKTWGESRRHLYAITQVSLDVVFPMAYGTLLACCLASVLPLGRWKLLAAVPVFAAGADLGENVILAGLAWTFTGESTPLAWAASMLTVVKQAMLLASIVLLLCFGIWRWITAHSSQVNNRGNHPAGG